MTRTKVEHPQGGFRGLSVGRKRLPAPPPDYPRIAAGGDTMSNTTLIIIILVILLLGGGFGYRRWRR